jgi:hypothetical protein
MAPGLGPRPVDAPTSVSWDPIPVASPPPIAGASMAYDAADGYLLLFGGVNPSGADSNATWTFGRGTWTQLSPGPAPAARTAAGMAYDAIDRAVVLYGGYNSSTGNFYSDTWTFTGGHWTQVLPATNPGPRAVFTFTYDPETASVILFGGTPIYDNTTWSYAARSWSQLSPSSSPPGRGYARGVYDDALGGILLYGGTTGFYGAILSDVWLFSDYAWSPISSATPLPALMNSALAYDPELGTVVAYGGRTGWNGNPVNYTLYLGASGGTNVTFAQNPGTRVADSMAYDPDVGAPVLFGGGFVTSGPGLDAWVFSEFAANLSVAPLSTLDVGQSTTFTVQSTDAPTNFGYDWSGGPTGCAAAENTLVCAPKETGRFTVSVTVTNLSTQAALALSGVPIAVDPALVVQVALSARSITVSQSVNASVVASGGSGVFTVRFTELPTGCALPAPNASEARCAPSAAGNYTIAVSANDTNGAEANASASFAVAVRGAPPTSGTTPVHSVLAPDIWIATGLAAVAAAILAVALRSRRGRVPRAPEPPDE